MNENSVDLDKELLTKNACIYSNERKKISESFLRRIDGISNVSSDGGFFRRPSFLKMQVGNEKLQLNAIFNRQKVKEHTAGMHGWVDRFHEISPIMNLGIMHKFIDQINQIYGVQVDSEFNFKSTIWKTLLKIAEPIEGVIFVHNSFIDCTGRIAFGYLADLVDEIRKDEDT
jgi:hypothetical protein